RAAVNGSTRLPGARRGPARKARDRPAGPPHRDRPRYSPLPAPRSANDEGGVHGREWEDRVRSLIDWAQKKVSGTLPSPALPKKRCLELSSLNKCWSFECLKVPDTFFWAKPPVPIDAGAASA